MLKLRTYKANTFKTYINYIVCLKKIPYLINNCEDRKIIKSKADKIIV